METIIHISLLMAMNVAWHHGVFTLLLIIVAWQQAFKCSLHYVCVCVDIVETSLC